MTAEYHVNMTAQSIINITALSIMWTLLHKVSIMTMTAQSEYHELLKIWTWVQNVGSSIMNKVNIMYSTAKRGCVVHKASFKK